MVDARLRTVLDTIGTQHDIAITFDQPALAEATIDPDGVQVTKHIEDTSLNAAIQSLICDAGLSYLVQGQGILITTRDKSWENLSVAMYSVPPWHDPRELAELLPSVICSDTWERVGGSGSIRVLNQANCLVIAQTEEVHAQLASVMSEICDGDLVSRHDGMPRDPAAIATRVHPVRDAKTARELQQTLVPLCNAALGAAADPDAKVGCFPGAVVVQSRKRGFHVYAAEMIRAIDGCDVTAFEYLGAPGSFGVGVGLPMGGMGGGGGFGMGGL